MSTLSISNSCNNKFISPLQGSSSFSGRVMAQLYKTANRVVCSINHIAQSILSKCVYVGSAGRYTLDDLKSYLFKDRVSLECRASLIGVSDSDCKKMEDMYLDFSSEEDNDIDQTTRDSEETAEEEVFEAGLKRQSSISSKISVTSSVYRDLQESDKKQSLYPSLLSIVKRSGKAKENTSSSPEKPFPEELVTSDKRLSNINEEEQFQ